MEFKVNITSNRVNLVVVDNMKKVDVYI